MKRCQTHSRSLLVRIALACVLACTLLNMRPAAAQSLKPESPAPLHQGNNQALIDSFVGDHYYYFYAEPGKFHIAWTFSGAQEGFDVGGKPSFAAVFNPKTAGSQITHKDGPTGVVYDGSVTQRTRVLVGVSPVNSKLVRQTTPYIVVVTGNVSFGNAADGPDPIVGVRRTPAGSGQVSRQRQDTRLEWRHRYLEPLRPRERHLHRRHRRSSHDAHPPAWPRPGRYRQQDDRLRVTALTIGFQSSPGVHLKLLDAQVENKSISPKRGGWKYERGQSFIVWS